MAVSTVTMLAPYDGMDTSDLRLGTTVIWTGGTGPFDVKYEWDDNTSFTTPIIVTNVGVTSPDSAVPTSDMGGFGTDWYCRVTVIDTADNVDEIQTAWFGDPNPTVTASHADAGFPVGNLIDGDPDTNWNSGIAQNAAVIQIDLDAGAAVTLDRIRVNQIGTGACPSLVLYWSDDGSGYTSIGTYNGLTDTGWNELTFSAISHRYWRIEDNGTTGDWMTIQEVELVSSATAGTFRLVHSTNVTEDLEWDAPFETSVKEVQSLYNDASGGDFTASFDGQGPTAAIPYNESAANLKTALQTMSNITDVGVTGAGTSGDPWIITFNDVVSNVPLITTNDAGLTAGTSTIAEDTQGNLSVKDALEDLASLTTVGVTGVMSSRYEIEITDPGEQDVSAISVDDDSLTPSDITITVTETAKGSSDAGVQDPAGSYNTINFINPDIQTRYLYVPTNVGVGFGEKRFELDGTTGNYLSTEDRNKLDANAAHSYQALAWINYQQSQNYTTYAEPLAFAGLGVQFEALGGANPTARPSTDVVTAPSDVRSMGAWIPAKPGFEARIMCQWRDATSSLGLVNGDWVECDTLKRHVMENKTAPASTTVARMRVGFRLIGGTPDPTAGEVFKFYDPMMVEGATFPAEFVPSTRIVGNVFMEADIIAVDYSTGATQTLIQNRTSNDGYALTLAAAGGVSALHGDGASNRFETSALFTLVDGVRNRVAVGYDVSTGAVVWYEAGVQVDTDTTATGAASPAGNQVRVGANNAGTERTEGTVFTALVRDGKDATAPIVAIVTGGGGIADGTVVDLTTWDDSTGREWTAHVSAGGVVVDQGADGDPDLEARYLYVNHNVGVGFGTDPFDDLDLGDGHPDDFDRFLYVNHLVTSAQPCPWLHTISPTLQSTGGTVTLFGDSFGALQSTYLTEIRLYATQDLLFGSYVLMSAVSWADDQVTVTVPSGASTGWIAVVHTNGSATCDGSAFKLLNVELVPANPDMGWWIQTVDKQNQVTADSTILPYNVTKASFQKVMNSVGSGMIEIPLSDPDIDAIIDPIMRKGVLIRVYLDARFRYAFFGEVLTHDWDEEGNAVARITGRGMEAVAEWTKVLPNDFPASPSIAPTWIYGSTDNLLSNPGFDDNFEDILSNPGGEDGNQGGEVGAVRGIAKGWSADGQDDDGDSLVTYIRAVFDAGAARTGEWRLDCKVLAQGGGMTQSFSCRANSIYHVRCYVKDVLASGMDIQLALGGADDIAAIGITYANNYATFEPTEIVAELDNVSIGTGATDGNWQVMDVEVLTGAEQTSIDVFIRNQDAAIWNVFQVDDVTPEGWGLGLEPWVYYDDSLLSPDSFTLSPTHTLDGSPKAVWMDPSEAGPGLEQLVTVAPNTRYTLTSWLYPIGTIDSWALAIVAENHYLVRGFDPNPDAQSNQWNQYQFIYTTQSDEDTIYCRMTYEGIVIVDPAGAWMESFSLVPGEDPAYAGKILNDVLDGMASAGKLTYLTRTFTDTKDSSGADFQTKLSMDIEPTESLSGLLDRLVALGHEWEIVPDNFIEGGDTGFSLNVYVARSFNPDSGIGTSYIQDLGGPVITPGDATYAGRIVKTAFNVNTVFALGDGGIWSQTTQFPYETVDIPAGDPAPLGYRESFGIIEDAISVSAGDSETVSEFAGARLIDEKGRERAIQLDMQRDGDIRPFLDFGVGDSLFVDMPPYNPDEPDPTTGVRSHPKRVRAIQAELAGEGSDVTFKLDIDRVIYEDELGWMALVAQLSERAPAENTGRGTGSVSGSGGTVSVIGPGTVEAGPHTHDLSGTEITNKVATGDVGGTLPGPLSVNKLKGVPFAGAIPAEVIDQNTLVKYDYTANSLVMESLAAGGGGGGSGGGALVLIEEILVTSSVASVTFSSIAGNYKNLVIEAELDTADASDQDRITIQVGNGTADSGSNYSYRHHFSGTSSGTTGSNTGSSILGPVTLVGAGDTSGGTSFTKATILNYADDAAWKSVYLWGYKSGDSYYQDHGGGLWRSNAVVDTITIAAEGGNLEGGRVRLYGELLNGVPVPAHVQQLADRTVYGETAHDYDDEFDDASKDVDWVELVVTGTTTWNEEGGVIAADTVSQASGDGSPILKPLDSLTSPLTIETKIQMLGLPANYLMAGLAFSDGVVAGSNNMVTMPFWAAGLTNSFRAGTWTNIATNYGDTSLFLTTFLYQQLIWVSANTFKYRYSADGVNWYTHSSGSAARTLTPTHFGLWVSTWSGVTNRLATFEYFRVTESDLSV